MGRTALIIRIAVGFGAVTISAIGGITIHLMAKMSEADARIKSERKLTIEKLLELPELDTSFQLYEVIGERALIVDDRGYWVIQIGSNLPDGSTVSKIGTSSIVTSHGETFRITK